MQTFQLTVLDDRFALLLYQMLQGLDYVRIEPQPVQKQALSLLDLLPQAPIIEENELDIFEQNRTWLNQWNPENSWQIPL